MTTLVDDDGVLVVRKANLPWLCLIATGVCALAACTDTADIFPMNDAGEHLGPIRASFVRTGIGSGPVTITMADGEVLEGRYRVAFGGGEAFGFSGGQSASALVITDGPVQFVATGPKTQILCRGSSSTMGHGSGQCQTYEGAVWAVSW
jgi:hypothetical protein